MSEAQEQTQAELPETFLADFNSSKSGDVSMAMAGLGGFQMVDGSFPDENTVIFKGTRADGTSITVSFEKGDKYKSPAELQAEDNKSND